MYQTKEQFEDHFHEIQRGDGYYDDRSYTRGFVEAAYTIYDKAKKGTIFLDFNEKPAYPGITIVGRLALKEGVWVESTLDYPSIDSNMKKDLKVLNEKSKISGSILDTEKWSLLANDAWLLGGLHGLTEFHFASRIIMSNVWDETRKRMTVMGRELIGITSFGYRIFRPYPNLEHVAICEEQDKYKALSSTLLTYRYEVKKYDSEAKFRKIFVNIPPEPPRIS